jgi:signal transduction histidine kinase
VKARGLTIPQRLLVASALAAGSSLLLAGTTLAFLDTRQARADLLMRRGIDAEMAGLHVSSALTFEDPAAAETTLQVLRLKADIDRACLYDRQDRLFASFLARGTACPAQAPDRSGAPPRDHVAVSRPVLRNGEVLGRLELLSNLDELYARSARLIGAGIVVTAVALALGLAVSSRYQRTLLQPLVGLASTAQAVADDQDYSRRVMVTGPGEIGLLVDNFNGMLAQVESRDRELQESKAELERRVLARTEALNEELLGRRRNEEQIRRLNEQLSQRLGEVTALNQEIESFSYSVSHDLRAPLRHVSGFVDLFRERCAANLDATGQRYLKVISDGATQMGQLIDDLLSFSRMSRAELSHVRVALEDLVEEVRREVERDAAGREIEWVVGGLPAVSGDRAMLRVVFVNLLSNAVKYTRGVERAKVEVGSRPEENGHCTVFVKDNGVGFDMKYAHKLFGVFQRLHRSEDFAGTGIGLATVRRIVSRHGGNVWVEAAPQKGATFYVSLARTEEA